MTPLRTSAAPPLDTAGGVDDGIDDVTAAALAARERAPGAHRELVVLTQHDVWRFLAPVTDRATARSLAQEAYVRAFAALSGYRGAPTARLWMLTIARDVAGQVVPLGRASTGPLARLPVDRRHAFVLTQHLGLGYAEAAVVMDCAGRDVRAHVARAREELVRSAPRA